MSDAFWGEDATGEPEESIRARVKSLLDPVEYLLWADRPCLPRLARMPLIPVLFVIVVAGLSGFSLAAMFGLVGTLWVDLRLFALALGLAPCVLGGLIAVHLILRGVRRWIRRRRLSGLVYAVTDHRALIVRLDGPRAEAASWSLLPGEATDTRRFENPDGSGDLYFLGRGEDHWLAFGFVEVPRVGLVESLARETLIESDQEWWRLGTASAY